MGTEDLSASSSTGDCIFILLFLVLLKTVLDSAVTFKREKSWDGMGVWHNYFRCSTERIERSQYVVLFLCGS